MTETLAQLSTVFLYAAMGLYAAAFIAFALDLARRGARATAVEAYDKQFLPAWRETCFGGPGGTRRDGAGLDLQGDGANAARRTSLTFERSTRQWRNAKHCQYSRSAER